MPGELAPSRPQWQRPLGALPIRQPGIAHAPAGLPDAQHRGQRLLGVTVDVDELRVGRNAGEERNSQCIPRLAIDPAQARGVDPRPVAGTVDQAALEIPAQVLDRPRLDVGGGEAVAVPLAVLRLELEDRVEDRRARAEYARRPGKGAVERCSPRPWRGDDEYGPLDHGSSFAFDRGTA